jgi:simple sugar transport system ATP-binding protein
VTTAPFALELTAITKSFGPVRALDGARLGVLSGEIHALLGENGAGKSTLVAIAAGLVRPDAGEIRRAGNPVSFAGPRAARRAGIALVPQHDLLVEAATVADNLALLDPLAPAFESARARRGRVDRVARAFDLDLGSPDARAGDLPVGTRQRIGIAGALQTDPDVLVLDEPTAVLSPDETAALFRALRRRAGEGRAVVLITHRLAEVFTGADRLTLLSRGRTLLESLLSATTPGEVAALLLGGAEVRARPAPLPPVARRDGAPPALALEGFRPSGSPAPPVSLAIAPEEALTLLAIDGNGADLLGSAVAGVRPAHGRMSVAGTPVSSGDPRAFRAAGGAFIPADRRAEGLVPGFSLAENLFLRRPPGRFTVDRAALAAFAGDRLSRFGVRASGPEARARELSGGNQQKLLLARELEPSPALLVAIHPTRGLDIASSEDVRARLLDTARSGAGVLVVTADPEEAQELGAPIRVVYRGVLSLPLPSTTNLATLGRLMAGLAA